MDGLEEAVRELTREIAVLTALLRSPDGPQKSATARIPADANGDLRVFAGKVLDLDLEPQEQEPASRTRHSYPVEFEAFWTVYPLKKDKLEALKAFRKALPQISALDLIEAAKRYRNDPNRSMSYTKYPAHWLNAGGYLDEDPLPARDLSPAERYAAEQAAERETRIAEARAMAESTRGQG